MNPINKAKRNTYRRLNVERDDMMGFLKEKSASKGFLTQKFIKRDNKRYDKKTRIADVAKALGVEVPAELRKTEFAKGIAYTSNLLQEDGALFLTTRKADKLRVNLKKAMQKKPSVIFVDKKTLDESDIKKGEFPIIPVENSKERFIEFYRPYRDAYKGKVIAITGSVGKTTTKRYIGAVLSRKHFTFVSPANENSVFNVADNVLGQLSGYAEFIQEIGASTKGSVNNSGRILRPDISVITNVKAHHLSEYGTIENVFRDKISLVENLTPGGRAVVNFDDERLAAYDYKCKVTSFGIETEKPVDFRAVNMVQNGTVLEMDVRYNGNETAHLKANLIGEFNAYNLLAAFALGVLEGVDVPDIQKAIAEYQNTDTRQHLIEFGQNYLFMDCYNVANDTIVNSVESLAGLELMPGGRRIAVVGGENKLGKERIPHTVELGRRLKDAAVDQIICYGTSGTDEDSLNRFGDAVTLYETLIKEGRTDVKLITDFDELVEYLRSEVRPGDAVLFKAIVYLNVPAAVDKVFGTGFAVRTPHVLKQAVNIKEKGFEGFTVADMKEFYVTEVDEKLLSEKKITIPDSLEGVPLFGLSRGLFAYSDVKELNLGNTVKSIGTGAFRGCTGIRELKVPDSVKRIMEGAFRECKGLEKVTLGKSVVQIDRDAFRDCVKLKEVYAPEPEKIRLEEGALPAGVSIRKTI